MSLTNLFLMLKGGAGSGNFGHGGRPGKRGGSAPGIQVYQSQLIEYNKGTDKERHIAVGPKGLIFDLEGQEHAVSITDKEAKELDKLNGDFVDLHNHPNNNAPSPADYDSWLRFQPKEARVVTREGTYILKPRNEIWFPGAKKDSFWGAGTDYYMSPNYYQSHGLKYPENDYSTLSKNALEFISKEGWLEYEFVKH